VNLELTRERQEAGELLEDLLNLTSMNQVVIKWEDDKIVKARAALVQELAKKLLGDSWSCATLT
jgi:hypothetical protein